MSVELAEVCFLTRDVRRLAAFYRDLLGTLSDSDDPVHQTFEQHGLQLSIQQDDSTDPEGRQRLVVAFAVDDVDAEHERLLGLGVQVLEPPTARPWGARNLVVADPDGNRVYLRTLLPGPV
ncbi:VOC family protein [Cellulomonas soli]|uniref:VOC family protein n=1 Tax=Cellulomonas soli TaxID=931535 RepID=UPI001D3E735B|nr:VOC family protein [Cellulomonadaceae bacterium]